MTDKKPRMDEATREEFREVRDHVRAAQDAWFDSFRAFLPPDFIAHQRKARKEALLAVRSLVDTAIEHLEDED